MSKRDALFGTHSFNRGTPAKMDAALGQQAEEDALRDQNDELLDQLSVNVSLLKDVSNGMGNELRTHNKVLDEMDTDFFDVGGLLSGTRTRLGVMMDSYNCKHMCQTACLLFGVMLLLYFLNKYRR